MDGYTWLCVLSTPPPTLAQRIQKKVTGRAVLEANSERGGTIDRGCWGKITPEIWAGKRETFLFWLCFPKIIADINNAPTPTWGGGFSNPTNLTGEPIIWFQPRVLLSLLSPVPLCSKWFFEHQHSRWKGKSVSKRATLSSYRANIFGVFTVYFAYSISVDLSKVGTICNRWETVMTLWLKFQTLEL